MNLGDASSIAMAALVFMSRFLIVYLILVLAVAPRAAQAQTLLSKELDEAAAALTAAARPLDPVEQAVLLKLLAAAGKSDCATEEQPRVKCKVDQIESFVVTPLTASNPAQQARFWSALTKLAKIFLLADVDFVAAMQLAGEVTPAKAKDPSAAASGLNTLISSKVVPAMAAADPASTLPRVKIDQMVVDISGSRLQLDTLLRKLSPAPRINVIGAWFGDMHAIYKASPSRSDLDGPRFCAATRAVRKTCQAQGTCSFGTPNTTIDGPHLCGYDPVPFGIARDKGLVIVYECLSAGVEKWRSLGTDNHLDVGNSDQARSARLRVDNVSELRCEGNYVQ